MDTGAVFAAPVAAKRENRVTFFRCNRLSMPEKKEKRENFGRLYKKRVAFL